MEVVAILALKSSVEQEAPVLAGELGLTPYETAMMLRGAGPVIVFRSEDRSRTALVLDRLRARGHDAVSCELDTVVSSDEMFRPKTFRFEPDALVASGNGEERRLAFSDVFAYVRATHATRVEDTVTTQQRSVSIGRAAMTGGLLMSKTVSSESKRVSNEREAVLYVFRSDAAPWLLASTQLRYDGLGPSMRRSKVENFDVLLQMLREVAPTAPYDARLLAVRANPVILTAGARHLSASSSSTHDLLAHVVAMALGKGARPYR